MERVPRRGGGDQAVEMFQSRDQVHKLPMIFRKSSLILTDNSHFIMWVGVKKGKSHRKSTKMECEGTSMKALEGTEKQAVRPA